MKVRAFWRGLRSGPVDADLDQRKTSLREMGRGYTAARFKEIVAQIRERIPDAAITADAIVGFPGETEEQFEARLRTIAQKINREYNLEGLCRELPYRIDALVAEQGEKIGK